MPFKDTHTLNTGPGGMTVAGGAFTDVAYEERHYPRLDDYTVTGVIQWPKTIGRPDADNVADAFLIRIGRMTVHQGAPGGQGYEVPKEFVFGSAEAVLDDVRMHAVKFTVYIEDTLHDAPMYDDRMAHRAIIALKQQVRWLTASGAHAGRMPVVRPDMIRFRKSGKTDLGFAFSLALA